MEKAEHLSSTLLDAEYKNHVILVVLQPTMDNSKVLFSEILTFLGILMEYYMNWLNIP
jgi:hypothetical protein